MKLYDAINIKDKFKLLGMLVITVICSIFFGFYSGKDVSQLVLLTFINVLFFIAFGFFIDNYYVLDELEVNVHKTIHQLLLIYVPSILIMFVCHMIIYPIHIILALSGLFCLLLPPQIGCFLACYLSIVLCLSTDGNVYELSFLILCAVMGAMVSHSMKQTKYRTFLSIIIFALCVTLRLISDFYVENAISFSSAFGAFAEGLINVLCISFVLPLTVIQEDEKMRANYGEALEDDFPLVLFMKRLDDKRVLHAKRTALLCYQCAKQLGINENLCSCAGFYYSLCDNDEEDSVSYAVNLGMQNLLPIDVVRIMSEYHSLKKVISSKEAAIVDLVDSNLEVLEAEHFLDGDKSQFDIEIKILSICNDISKSGRYDESGLGMNSFLVARDCMVKEVSKL